MGKIVNGWDVTWCNWAWDGGAPTISREVGGELVVLILMRGGRFGDEDAPAAGGDVALVVVDQEGAERGATVMLSVPRWEPALVAGAAIGAMAVRGYAQPAAGNLLEAVLAMFTHKEWPNV